jgi:hypothetical protein
MIPLYYERINGNAQALTRSQHVVNAVTLTANNVHINAVPSRYTTLFHIAAGRLLCCRKNININHLGVFETNVRKEGTRAQGNSYS